MEHIKQLYNFIMYWVKRLEEDAVSAFSAQAAFFIMLAAFPLLMLLAACLQYLPWDQELMQAELVALFPGTLQEVAREVLGEIYTQATGIVLSFTAITAIWSVSRGVYALLQGIRAVYKPFGAGKNEIASWKLRGLSVAYTLFLLLLIVFVMGLWLFGFLHFFIAFFIMVLFCILLYTAASPKDGHLFRYIPGAMLSAVGWVLFTWVYGIYIRYFSGFSKFYGSLTSVVFLMLWLYFCMYILLAGAECNEWIQERNSRKGDRKSVV